MNYRNSVKILFSNFEHVWKMMLYFLIVSAISIFFLYLAINPIYVMLVNSGVFSNMVQVYTDFLTTLNLTELMTSLGDMVNNVFATITSHMSTIWFSFLGIALVFAFFEIFSRNLVTMPLCNSLNFYMGSMNKRGFYASFSDTFGKNVKIQLCYYIVTLPFKFAICYLFLLSFKLFSISWVVSVVAIIVLLIAFILLISLIQSVFVMWVPTYVIMNYGVFKSLKYSVKMLGKRFGRVFSGMVGVIITVFLLNFILGVFTLFMGLLISIPISYLLYNVYGMICAYEGQGMRYYVDIYNVITPKKKEISDKLNDMKYIV
ncbi:MAG: hypothetical protein E7345_00855 [Clostridiales bacterium]|nr:hypothetical protein [Clostridiales bacterium]